MNRYLGLFIIFRIYLRIRPLYSLRIQYCFQSKMLEEASIAQSVDDDTGVMLARKEIKQQ